MTYLWATRTAEITLVNIKRGLVYLDEIPHQNDMFCSGYTDRFLKCQTQNESQTIWFDIYSLNTILQVWLGDNAIMSNTNWSVHRFCLFNCCRFFIPFYNFWHSAGGVWTCWHWLRPEKATTETRSPLPSLLLLTLSEQQHFLSTMNEVRTLKEGWLLKRGKNLIYFKIRALAAEFTFFLMKMCIILCPVINVPKHCFSVASRRVH